MLRAKNFILVFTIFFIISCSGQTPTLSEENIPIGESPYPVSQETPNSYPPSNMVVVDVTQTIDPILGQIKGVLLENGKPVKNEIIYLANVITDQKGQVIAFSFDRVTSSRTVTTSTGAFKFINVKPGTYGLVLDLIIDSFLLLNPMTSEQMKVEVISGEEVDLGTLNYDLLPIGP